VKMRNNLCQVQCGSMTKKPGAITRVEHLPSIYKAPASIKYFCVCTGDQPDPVLRFLFFFLFFCSARVGTLVLTHGRQVLYPIPLLRALWSTVSIY
jgi:hypothetical protein